MEGSRTDLQIEGCKLQGENLRAEAASPHFSQGFVARRCRGPGIQGATENPAGAFEKYVEESKGAQRSRYGHLRRRSRKFVRNAG